MESWQSLKDTFLKEILADEWKAFETGNKILRRIRKEYVEEEARQRELENVQKETWERIQKKAPWIATFENMDCAVNKEDLGWGLFCYIEELVRIVQKYRLNRIGRESAVVLECMVKHLFEHHTITAVAEELEWDRHEMSKMLKKKVGMSTGEYCNMLKMEWAGKMLQEKNQKIAEIASQLGYLSVEKFDKMFKEQMGCTPQSWEGL